MKIMIRQINVITQIPDMIKNQLHSTDENTKLLQLQKFHAELKTFYDLTLTQTFQIQSDLDRCQVINYSNGTQNQKFLLFLFVFLLSSLSISLSGHINESYGKKLNNTTDM